MDLGLFARVLWRQRYLVAAGILLALIVSTLAGYKVTSKGLAPRAEPTYTSVASIFVVGEQGGAFRAVAPRGQEDTARSREDPGELADVYAQLVVSDPVKRRVERVFGPLEAKKARVTAFRQVARTPGPPVAAGRTRPLPFIEIDAMAPNPGTARQLANLTAETFLRYVDEQQVASGIPPDQRVSLMLARSGTTGRLTSKSPLSLVLILFLGFLTCFVVLAAILHNVAEHRRRRSGAEGVADEGRVDEARTPSARYPDVVTPGAFARAGSPGSDRWSAPVLHDPEPLARPAPPAPVTEAARPEAPPEQVPVPESLGPVGRPEPVEPAERPAAPVTEPERLEPERLEPAMDEAAPAPPGAGAPLEEPARRPPPEPVGDRYKEPVRRASRPASAIPWWQVTTVPTVDEQRASDPSVSTGGHDPRGEDNTPEKW